MGVWDSEEDFAQHIVDECYDLEKTMGSLSNFFDYKRYADELFMFDFHFGKHGNVFRKI